MPPGLFRKLITTNASDGVKLPSPLVSKNGGGLWSPVGGGNRRGPDTFNSFTISKTSSGTTRPLLSTSLGLVGFCQGICSSIAVSISICLSVA